MPIQVLKQGTYELFVTTKDHRIIVLDESAYYAWVEGGRGEILVGTDDDHQKKETSRRGDYYLVDFRDDPKFKDMPHLFLQAADRFDEFVLPTGLPDADQLRRRIIETDYSLSRAELEEYLAHPAPPGPGEERMGTPAGGSMANVTRHLAGIEFPADPADLVRHAKENGAPRAVLAQLERIEEQTNFETMADVTEAIGRAVVTEKDLAISNYGERSAREIVEALGELEPDELARVREVESKGLGRKTILRRVDAIEKARSADLPIEHYEALTVEEIHDVLDRIDDPEKLREIREFEQEHKARKTVLRAVERRLAK